jgi:RNA polymerase sigma factor (sigma-70 family)
MRMFLKLFSSSKPEPDDQELVRQYRETGDPAGLGRLFERHTEMVYLVCYKYLQEEAESKDAVMEIFERLAQSLEKHEVSNFKSWLHVIAKNHCLMQLRRRSHRMFQHPADLNALADMQNGQEQHPSPGEDLEANLTLLEKGLEVIPPEQRDCVALFYLQQKSYKEIAVLTGLDLNKVRSHLQNGRRNLKIYLEKHHEAQ